MARILVVEDDPRTVEFLRAQLQAAGHECIGAANGEQALALAKRAAADLLILDIMLPGGMSGFEICRRIRSDNEINFLPILMLSAMSAYEEIMHGLAQGADDYITKPFEMPQLLLRIDNLLRMNSDVRSPDDLTALPGPGAMKREVQKRLTRHDVFSLVGTELVRLREFSFHCGADSRQKAIRHVARALHVCGQDLRNGEFVVGHMGGGYFISIVNPEQTDRFCRRVAAAWEQHLPMFYDSIGFGKPYRDSVNEQSSFKFPILALLTCATTCHQKDAVNTKDLFDILTRMRGNALTTGAGGVYIDRRG